jgi:hypothetical protein
MAYRLDRPVTVIATFFGPVTMGQFGDGAIIIAGPQDQPVIIINGQVRRLIAKHPNGDMEFEGAVSAVVGCPADERGKA